MQQPATFKPGDSIEVPLTDRGDYKLSLLTVETSPDGTKTTQVQDTQTIQLFARTTLAVVATRQAELLDKAFNDVLKVDPTSTFAPFGEAPRPGRHSSSPIRMC